MNISTIRLLIASSIIFIAACGDADSFRSEAPNTYNLKHTLLEMPGASPIDQLTDLECKDLGKSKYFCSYKIHYVGLLPERQESCIYAGASEYTIHDNTRCY